MRLKRGNSGNVIMSGRVRNMRSIVRSLGSVRVLRSFRSSRRGQQVLDVLLLLGLDVVHRPNRQEYDVPGRGSTDTIERLTRVHAQVRQAHQVNLQHVIGVLLVLAGRERKHRVTPPPSYLRPWPARGVAADLARGIHVHSDGGVRLAGDLWRAVVRF